MQWLFILNPAKDILSIQTRTVTKNEKTISCKLQILQGKSSYNKKQQQLANRRIMLFAINTFMLCQKEIIYFSCKRFY